VRELSHVAGLFDELVHVAPVEEGDLEVSMEAYGAGNVRVAGVKPSGGDGIAEKAGVVAAWREYGKVIWREVALADAVHVRLPCNIGLLALLVLCIKRTPRRRWFKYAGNWKPAGPEPWSYRLQRWILRCGWAGGVVTVNGEWEGEPPHVRPFLNPSLTEEDLERGRAAAEEKRLEAPLRLVFAGRVEEAKGAGRAVELVRRLREAGIECELDVAGDGPLRSVLEERVRRDGLDGVVRLHGWLGREEIRELYKTAHFCVLLSECSEGWPKVLSEAMAYGAVPVASETGGIASMLQKFGCGVTVAARDVEAAARAIAAYAGDPGKWRAESERGVMAAEGFTYEAHVRRVAEILGVGRE
jgi:glycosyltransferase involved in cell wall biosynthesis